MKEKILHRPRPEDLVGKGILEEDPRSPSEEKSQKQREALYEERIEEEYAKREGGA